ncbi:leucine-rich repeat-containing protein 42 [Ctenodactylus gundi]
MSYYLNSENRLDPEPGYVRENGQLHMVSLTLDGVRSTRQRPHPFRLFPKGFSVELCMNREDDTAQKEKTDHFIFTYTREGNLRYSAKSLFSLVLGFISDNVDHIDSLIGFPEQIAEKLFFAAEARQKFIEPGTGLRALQKFTEAYGSLVLCSLCLQNRYPVIAKTLDEIKSFRGLTRLDLSCCKLGDEHELLEHLTNEALSSLTQLHLKDNCLSDAGLRKMTAPVRVMKKGLENLMLLDLSYNPDITDAGIEYLFCFRKLNCLDISEMGIKDIKAVIHKLQTRIGLIHSEVPLKEFDHSNCKTEGWADQVKSIESLLLNATARALWPSGQMLSRRHRLELPPLGLCSSSTHSKSRTSVDQARGLGDWTWVRRAAALVGTRPFSESPGLCGWGRVEREGGSGDGPRSEAGSPLKLRSRLEAFKPRLSKDSTLDGSQRADKR